MLKSNMDVESVYFKPSHETWLVVGGLSGLARSAMGCGISALKVQEDLIYAVGSRAPLLLLPNSSPHATIWAFLRSNLSRRIQIGCL
jgi:hypothetical protein